MKQKESIECMYTVQGPKGDMGMKGDIGGPGRKGVPGQQVRSIAGFG